MEIRIEKDRKPSSVEQVSVMVVDDDVLITKLVGAAMKNMGVANVYPMNDPHQALDFVAEGLRGTDLIICDLMMPEVDGLDVLREVRKINSEIPFLMLTADGKSDSVKKAVELGVTSYMVKPFSVGGLQSKVQQLIVRAYGKAAIARTQDQHGTGPETSWS